MHLYELLLDELRKGPRDNTVEKLIDEVSEEPAIQSTGTQTSYCFRRHGFMLSYDESTKRIWTVFIYLNVPKVWADIHQGFETFSDYLPAGITAIDNRDTVRTKLGADHQLKSYEEKAFVNPPQIADEQWERFAKSRRDGSNTVQKTAVQAWIKERNDMPDTTVIDVYGIDGRNWHFHFSCGGEELLGIRLYEED